MRLSNIIHLFLQCLLLSGTIAVPLHLLETSGPPLFELFLEENGEFVPLNRSDPLHMPPEPSYKGLPMKTQWNEYNEVQHVVQIELLDIHTYRKHFLAGPSWQDLELSDEDVEDIRQSHFNESYDPEPYAEAKMKKLMKRDPYYITPVPCTDGTVRFRSTGIIHNTQPLSIGAVHLACQQICYPVKGSYSATVQHQSTIGWSVSSKDFPYAQTAVKNYFGEFAQHAIGFIKELGLGVSGSEADSVSYSHSYTADCLVPNSACFLIERPNVIVRKGDSEHRGYTTQGSRCSKYDFKTTGWEAHSLYGKDDAKGVIPPKAYVCPKDAIRAYKGSEASAV
ncbi:hypothetical protein IWX90DRAFT_411590 [Phyllosticta citrichinensis]|uniref:Uncharacterized protein n=1 Tax=Phyllosticta citrichinensis TaxID=1130410 RepID=A0ABR1Y1P4_9PEZI